MFSRCAEAFDAGAVRREVAHQHIEGIRWLEREHVFRTRPQQHIDDSAGAAADFRDALASHVFNGEQRTERVLQQRDRAVVPLVILKMSPLVAEIVDGALRERAEAVCRHRDCTALTPTAHSDTPKGARRRLAYFTSARNSCVSTRLMSAVLMAFSVRTGMPSARRSLRAAQIGTNST